MNTKHTKGQWIKHPKKGLKTFWQIRCNGKVIALIKELSNKGNRTVKDIEEESANAQIIMYAPELLQMVRDLQNCVKRLTQDNLSQFDRDLEAEWISNSHELLNVINPDYYNNANKIMNG